MKISEYYNWLKKDWAKIGLIISIFLFVFLVVFVRKQDFIVFIILVQTPLYMLHETEEYVFPGGFGSFFNKDIFKVEAEKGPVDENFIFFVNIILIWVALPIFGLLSTINYQYGLWIPYFTFFAGVAHFALAIKAKKVYNPGMLVSLFLNIPIGLWSIIYLLNNSILNSLFLNPHFVIGLAVNALLPVLGTFLLKNYKKTHNNAPDAPKTS